MNLFRALFNRSLFLLCIACCFGPLQAATMSAGFKGLGVAIEGEIKPGDFEKFIEFKIANKSNPRMSADVVFLNSPGGNVKEALKFAKAFSSSFYSTFVLDGKSCFSACTMIWAGGVDRTIMGTGRLGFHRLSFSAKEVDVKKSKAILDPENSKVVAFFKDVGLPNSLIEKMNETAPTDLFIVNERWLIDHELNLAIRYQPAFLDVVEKRCGAEPTTEMFRKNQPLSQEILAKFNKWLECAEDVKDANHNLRINEAMKNDAADERTLRQIGESIARTKWTVLFATDDVVAKINKSSQQWSAPTIKVQSIADFKSKKMSTMDYKIIDCDNGTIANVEGATSVMCDGNMCKTPIYISKNEYSTPKKSDPGSFNALFVEAICKTR